MDAEPWHEVFFLGFWWFLVQSFWVFVASGLRVYGFCFKVEGGFSVFGAGFGVFDSGLRVQGFLLKVEGVGVVLASTVS